MAPRMTGVGPPPGRTQASPPPRERSTSTRGASAGGQAIPSITLPKGGGAIAGVEPKCLGGGRYSLWPARGFARDGGARRYLFRSFRSNADGPDTETSLSTLPYRLAL